MWHYIIIFVVQNGSPPLHDAIAGGYQDIAELLIEKYNAIPLESTNVRLIV